MPTPNQTLSPSPATKTANLIGPRVAAMVAVTAVAAAGTSCRDVAAPARDAGAREYAATAYMAVVTEGPQLPQGRGSHAGGVVEGRVVVAGGSSWSSDRTTKHWLADCLVFDDKTKEWSPGPTLPHPIAEMMFANDDNSLYIAGGKDGQTVYADAYRVSVRDGRLTSEPMPPLPVALSGGAGALMDGVFYVAGGYDAHGDMTDTLWALDVTRGGAVWRACAPLPLPRRSYAAMTACGGALYLLGGCVVENATNPTRQVFKDVLRYDPPTDSWKRLLDLPTRGQGWVATAVDDDHLLLVGRGDTDIYDDIWLVDVRDSSVHGLGSLVTPSFGAPLVRIAPRSWWFIGGEPDAKKSRTPRVSVIRIP